MQPNEATSALEKQENVQLSGKGATSDLISRQAAIDAIEKLDIPEDMCVFEIVSHVELAIGTLPSAQPTVDMQPVRLGSWLN